MPFTSTGMLFLADEGQCGRCGEPATDAFAPDWNKGDFHDFHERLLLFCKTDMADFLSGMAQHKPFAEPNQSVDPDAFETFAMLFDAADETCQLCGGEAHVGLAILIVRDDDGNRVPYFLTLCETDMLRFMDEREGLLQEA